MSHLDGRLARGGSQNVTVPRDMRSALKPSGVGERSLYPLVAEQWGAYGSEYVIFPMGVMIRRPR